MIARYELLMARRRHARDRLVLAEDVVKLLAEEGEEEMSLRHKQLEVLDDCLKKLPRERRDLALAAYSRDTSIRELATQLGRTEGSLYQLLSGIRMQLFDCINRSLEHSL